MVKSVKRKPTTGKRRKNSPYSLRCSTSQPAERVFQSSKTISVDGKGLGSVLAIKSSGYAEFLRLLPVVGFAPVRWRLALVT